MLLEIPLVVIRMVLSIKSLTKGRHGAHPANLVASSVGGIELRTLLFQLLGNSINIHIKVVPKEVTNFRVLVVAGERRSSLWVGAEDVDVCSGMAVGTPASLGSAGDDIGKCIWCRVWGINKQVDLLLAVIVHSQALFDLVGDECSKVAFWVTCPVREIVAGQSFRGFGDIGKNTRVPSIFWVCRVKFWRYSISLVQFELEDQLTSCDSESASFMIRSADH
jgi:hypothetical protein